MACILLDPTKPTITADPEKDHQSITLEWQSVDHANLGLTYYLSCTDDGGDCSPIGPITDNQATISNLFSATEYTIQVEAYYRGKYSEPSHVTVTTSKY